MASCWYCHWGWPKPVHDIYVKYRALLGDDYEALEEGPAHIVWGDENFEDFAIYHCLSLCKNPSRSQHFGYSGAVLPLVTASLEELLTIPEEQRCIVPEGYDGVDPSQFPPPKGVEVARID